MDRISQALMDEFARDHQLDHLPEDSRFEHFGAYLAVGRHHQDTFETSDLVTGSGGDTGVDAIATIVNGSLVVDSEEVGELAERNGYLEVTFVFVQAERSAHFETAKIGQFGFGVQDFFKSTPQLPRNEAVKEATAIMSAIYERSGKFTRGNPHCHLFYVTTGKWKGDANLEARMRAVIDDLTATRMFGDVTFTPVGADELQRYYNQTKNAAAREFVFSEKTLIPEIPGVKEAYLGLLPQRISYRC